MECTTLELLPEFKHRYKANAKLYNIKTNLFDKVTLFFDLGCYNTMIPKRLAVSSGVPTGLKRKYAIGGTYIETEAYLIKKIILGGFTIERIVAFTAEYRGEFAHDILIGTNVMNNWKMNIDKKANIFQFCENPPDYIPNKKNIYQNYFDLEGNYMYVQDTFLDE